MLSNLNYFTRKEERSVYKNRFVRSYEVEKEDLSVKKTRLWFVFECEALKLVQYFAAKNDDFNGTYLFVFFSEIKRHFAKKVSSDFSHSLAYLILK